MNNASNNAAKKITLATFKKFLKDNEGKVSVSVRQSHNSDTNDKTWFQRKSERMIDRSFGIAGIWLVLGGGDSFEAWEGEGFRGIKVNNSCSIFIVGVPA